MALSPGEIETAAGVVEPARLRRRGGESVYEVAGATRYTSTRILAAEQRLLAAAARRDGPVAAPATVEVAVLEAVANGVQLNAGQVALVRAMATSPARLQLAIAPAGTGKTTAMRSLAHAWTDSGGHVIGLAPSAAAAAALGEQLGAATETVAKLTWSLTSGDLPAWAAAVGPSTLVVLDEAAMADTLSLDAVVTFAVSRGATVRLVGDDAQLAAIGAGGVLRDIAEVHGAVRLHEVVRFTDPAEAAASLALREGRPEALGYYLDHDRVHVGDLATLTEDVFAAWRADRGRGLDAVMLAPTRDLVTDLNRRARQHRLNGTTRWPPRRQQWTWQPWTGGGGSGRREPGQRRRHHHHPAQRPPPRRVGHRLGQERRPVADRDRRRRRGAAGAAPAAPAAGPPARRLRVPPRSTSGTPARSTPLRASPPTPCTACSPAPSPANSSTPWPPGAASATTSTSRWSATATSTPSSVPRRSPRPPPWTS